MTQTIAASKSLYEQDLNLWLETAIAQLKSRNLQDLDIDNLIEELEGLAGRDRRELKNTMLRASMTMQVGKQRSLGLVLKLKIFLSNHRVSKVISVVQTYFRMCLKMRYA